MSSPSIHELYDPLYHSPHGDLYQIYTQLRAEHPVYHCERRDVWCLSRYEDIQAAARDWESFSNANGVDLDRPAQYYGVGDFLDSDPPRHDVLRKVVRPFFIPKEIARLEGDVVRRVQTLVARLAEEEQIDIAQDFARALPVWMICRLLGVPESDDEMILDIVTRIEQQELGEVLSESAFAAVREMHAYIEDFAEHKRRNLTEDLMSHMVAGEADGAPRREEIPGMAVLLFDAGSMTTNALLGNMLWLLAQHEDVQQALRERPDELIEPVVEETLRVESPIQYLARHTTKTARLHDVEIPADADVIFIYGAANRDERRFEHAERFDIHRSAQRHLGFGEGIHFCLGAPLARLEARIAVPAFLQAIPSYEIEQPTERQISHTMRLFSHLPAKIG